METLITIGVVIYILVSIRKAMSYGKDKTGAKKPASGGWQEKLQDMARQIKEEMEKAQREAEGLPPVPPPLPAEPVKTSGGMEWESLEESSDESRVMEEWVDEQSQDLEIQGQAEFPFAGAEPVRVEQVPIPEKAWIGTEQRNPRQIKFRQDDLKRALIWSEILAKPVGLRDSFDGDFLPETLDNQKSVVPGRIR